MNNEEVVKAPEFNHKSVLVQEVLEYLNPQPGKLYVDATFGGGGHTRAILEKEPGCRVLAIDWDMQAIELNAAALKDKYGERCKVTWGNFALLYKILKKENLVQVDGVLADFGTSQFQIHHKDGFSFRQATPLDMRMSAAHQSVTAAYIVNNYSYEGLVKIFQEYGQEPLSRKIAEKIVQERKVKRITTTDDLVAIIESLVNVQAFRAKRGIHPATQIFQALRIEVNNELDNIVSFLNAATKALSKDGNLVCISFHSLEDRIVKNFFKEKSDQLTILTQKPVTAGEEELFSNASSRSAKLRAARKMY